MEISSAKIIVRVSKSGKMWNKGLKYFVMWDGDNLQEIDNLNDRIEYLLPGGLHVITVANKNMLHKQELTLKNGEVKTITINPSVSFRLGFGILIGIAAAGSLISIIIMEKMNPAPLIPLIPLLFVKKKNFHDNFALSTLDKA
ncbi:hypothetical protein [Daejeonella sp.]|jgi:hypothetical protein|uniref:hypothetical protein n=1 Tax=Daejeonella sp. TaxID=2805397 RepID=UPI0037BED0E7